MAKDYGTRRSTARRASMPNQLLLIFLSFLVGYMTASFFKVDLLSHWMQTQVQAYHEAKPDPIKPAAREAELPPKPKFEFYTLLANEKRPLAANTTPPKETSTTAPSVVPPPTIKEQQAELTGAPVFASSQSSTAVKLAEKKQVVNPTSLKPGENFSVQVASFKTRKDAEHMKAVLSLRGYLVNVIQVRQAQGIWFRVMVGPYANRQLAQKAQGVLAKNEHINGMVKSGN